MNQFLNFNFTHPDASLADVLRDPMVQTVLANSCMGHLGALSTSVDALLRRFDRMVGLTVADVLPYIFGYEFIQHFDRCFGKVTEISEKLRLLLREANEKGGVKFDETLLDTADVEALQVLVERGVVCLDKDAMLRFSCPLASRFMVNYIYRRVDS